jgi:TolA protein
VTNQSPVAEPTGASYSVFQLSPRDRKRIGWALMLSVYYHALIISLQFGADGIGLLGFTIPWPEKRVETRPRDARVVEVPRPPAAPVPTAPVAPRESQATATAKEAKPLTASRSALTVELRYLPPADVTPPPTELSTPRRETVARAPAAKARAPERKIRPKPRPPVLALRQSQEDTFKVPPAKVSEPEPQRAPDAVSKKESEETPPAAQAEPVAKPQAEDLARTQSDDAARQRADEEARQRALALEKEIEGKKQAEARRLDDARKQEEARRQALELEARKLAEDKARQEAEELARQRALALQKEIEAKKLEDARRIEETRKREEAAKQAELKKQEEAAKQAELKKQEEARRLALELEALKRAEELARQQAIARKELEAKRQAEEAAARQREAADRARADAEAAAQRAREGLAKQQAPGPAPGALSGKELASKAIDQLRAGRIDPSRPPSPSPGLDNPRRRAIQGIERDVSLRMYVESWRWKIERTGAVNYRPSAAWRASENPIVTVSIRSDGTVEDVFIHRSSGVRELDEAVRRIARLHSPYSAFPPDLARQYDVIDIRRVWSFENTLRILDEM